MGMVHDDTCLSDLCISHTQRERDVGFRCAAVSERHGKELTSMAALTSRHSLQLCRQTVHSSEHSLSDAVCLNGATLSCPFHLPFVSFHLLHFLWSTSMPDSFTISVSTELFHCVPRYFSVY